MLNFQYKTICRGKQSLIAQLRRRLQPLNRDPLEYITFNSLRTYGSLQGRFVTEQIYVHDKVCLCDICRHFSFVIKLLFSFSY